MSYSKFIPVLILVLAPTLVFAQGGAPDSLSFQGRLTTPAGVPIDTPSVSMTFKLYKDGSAVWEETQPSVVVTDGVFNVLLGSVTPLDTVAFNRPIEVGITVGADPEISPKTPLAAAPFALGMRGMYAVWAEDDEPNKSFNVIGGAPNNSVAAGVVGATIGGGGGTGFGTASPNAVAGDFGTVGGGISNTAGEFTATVGGGLDNTAAGIQATVGGGFENTAGIGATVGGGFENTAGGLAATVGGGNSNTAGGSYSAVGGGENNTAGGLQATVPGGDRNRANGGNSFAAGRRAKADHGGTFVWADSTSDTEFVSTGPDQFLIRAAGGVGIGTNAPLHPLHMASGAHVTAGGVWTSMSSRELKEDFQAVDGREVLEQVANLPVTRWRYLKEDGAVHMGPVAEDFYAIFGLGQDDAHIAALDGNGVALAAIQGLFDIVKNQQAEIEALKQRLER